MVVALKLRNSELGLLVSGSELNSSLQMGGGVLQTPALVLPTNTPRFNFFTINPRFFLSLSAPPFSFLSISLSLSLSLFEISIQYVGATLKLKLKTHVLFLHFLEKASVFGAVSLSLSSVLHFVNLLFLYVRFYVFCFFVSFLLFT